MDKAIREALDKLAGWHGVWGKTSHCDYPTYRETMSVALGISPAILDAAARTGLLSTAFDGEVTFTGAVR